jgi:hypothetical protein
MNRLKSARRYAQRIGEQLIALSPRGGFTEDAVPHKIKVARWRDLHTAWKAYLVQYEDEPVLRSALLHHLGIGIAQRLWSTGATIGEIERALRVHDVDADPDLLLDEPVAGPAAPPRGWNEDKTNRTPVYITTP